MNGKGPPTRSMAGRHNPWLIAWVVSIPTFMEVLDTAIANVSLRHIAGSMVASCDESTWVLTSYLVANAIVLPVLFVPIITRSYEGLPPGKSNNASALVNLCRNLGGSAGIPAAQTGLAQRAQFHQSWLTPFDESYREFLDTTPRSLGGGPQGTARAQLSQVAARQAEMPAFIDISRLLMVAALAMVPLALLMRSKAKAREGQG